MFPEVTTTAPPLALKKPPLFGSWDSRLPIEDIDHDSHQCHQHIINDNDNTNKQTINNVTTLKEIPLPGVNVYLFHSLSLSLSLI